MRASLIALLLIGLVGCGDAATEAASDDLLTPGESDDPDLPDNHGAPDNNGTIPERDPTDRPSGDIDAREPLWTETVTLGSAGGVLPLGDVGSLTIPAGALSEEVGISVTAYDPHAITEVTTLGHVYVFEPTGLALALPATIELPFSSSLSAHSPADVAILWGVEGEPSTALVGHNDFDGRRAYGHVHSLARGTVVLFDPEARACCATESEVTTTTATWCRDLQGDARPHDFCYSVCCATEQGQVWMHNSACIAADGEPMDAVSCQP